jgi:hypothetical protein
MTAACDFHMKQVECIRKISGYWDTLRVDQWEWFCASVSWIDSSINNSFLNWLLIILELLLLTSKVGASSHICGRLSRIAVVKGMWLKITWNDFQACILKQMLICGHLRDSLTYDMKMSVDVFIWAVVPGPGQTVAKQQFKLEVGLPIDSWMFWFSAFFC